VTYNGQYLPPPNPLRFTVTPVCPQFEQRTDDGQSCICSAGAYQIMYLHRYLLLSQPAAWELMNSLFCLLQTAQPSERQLPCLCPMVSVGLQLTSIVLIPMCFVCSPFGQQKSEPGPQRCRCNSGYYNVTAVQPLAAVQCIGQTGSGASPGFALALDCGFQQLVCRLCAAYALGPDPASFVQSNSSQDCYRCLSQCMDCSLEVVDANAIVPLPGFWQGSPNSPYLYECWNQDACVGGAPKMCATGFEGD
jgi:hypothetical protein